MEGEGKKGKVYLVGAGPGDSKLITVRGMECLQRSDVVVYDRLASPRLLQKTKPGSKHIYVGKRTDRHTMKQENINQLLVDLALEGHTVTRLKGGDPTVFGRVGEEAELLYDNGIEFEIVPGVTSAIAVPAYAGIPVTHRDLASSFSVITGHENPDKLDRAIRWDRVTNAVGTLVFLMGVAKIGYIAQQLIFHGRSPDTPVALVRWGTRAEQRTLIGTLATIEQVVEAQSFKPPAIIIVGEVVKQREKLRWFERKPLFGTRILVTRARSQASDLVSSIEELGGEPCEFPVIETKPIEGEDRLAKLEAALSVAEDYHWIVFTSAAGVTFFYHWLAHFGIDIRRFHRSKIAAVGPKTAAALAERGIIADVIPSSSFQAEGLLAELEGMLMPGDRVLLPRGDLARSVLPEVLTQRGMYPVDATTYETVLADTQDEMTLEWLQRRRISMITFTSSSTVTNLLQLLRNNGIADPVSLLDGVPIASIGEITSQTVRDAGLKVTVQAEEATIDSLVQAITAYQLERKQDLEATGDNE